MNGGGDLRGFNLGETMIKILGALLFASLLSAQVIDAGSTADSGFTGGSAWLIPQALLPDTTLRFGADFSYQIPCVSKRVYIVTFQFIEPTVHNPFERSFSVSINNQPVFNGLDLVAEAGYLKPMTRSTLAVCSEGQFRIRFLAQVRSAVVSSMEIEPAASIGMCSRQSVAISAGLEWTFGPVESGACYAAR